MSALSGAVYGLRTFRVTPDGQLLPAKNNATSAWVGGAAIAQCTWQQDNHPDEASPARNCTCGIYSWRDLQALRRQYWHSHVIVGVISLEGTTYVGSRGWRAQKARLVALWMNQVHIPAVLRKRIVEQCAEPVAVYREVDKMIDEYPGLALRGPTESDHRTVGQAPGRERRWPRTLALVLTAFWGLFLLFTMHSWAPGLAGAHEFRDTAVIAYQWPWALFPVSLGFACLLAMLKALFVGILPGSVTEELIVRPLVASLVVSLAGAAAGLVAQRWETGRWLDAVPPVGLAATLVVILCCRAAWRRWRPRTPMTSPLAAVFFAWSIRRNQASDGDPYKPRTVQHRWGNRLSRWASRHPVTAKILTLASATFVMFLLRALIV